MGNQRKSLTIAEKVKILDKVHDIKPRPTIRELSITLGVSKTTLVNLLQKEDQIRIEFLQSNPNSTIKRKRFGKNPEIEIALKEWFETVAEKGTKVTGPMLREKAETFAKELNYPDFKVTDGWLSRWKARNGIKSKRSHEKDAKIRLENELEKASRAHNPVNAEDVFEINDHFLQCYQVEEDSNSIKKEFNGSSPSDGNEKKEFDGTSPSDGNDLELLRRIVGNIKKQRTELINNTKAQETISHDAAKECIEQLRIYFLEEENERTPWDAFNKCSHYVLSKSNENHLI